MKIKAPLCLIALAAIFALAACGTATPADVEKSCEHASAKEQAYLTCTRAGIKTRLAIPNYPADQIAPETIAECEESRKSYKISQQFCVWYKSSLPGKTSEVNFFEAGKIAENNSQKMREKALKEIQDMLRNY